MVPALPAPAPSALGRLSRLSGPLLQLQAACCPQSNNMALQCLPQAARGIGAWILRYQIEMPENTLLKFKRWSFCVSQAGLELRIFHLSLPSAEIVGTIYVS